MPSRFFYPEDRPDAPPCDQHLLAARVLLRSVLLSEFGQDTDRVVRAIDWLIEAHVADYAAKHRQSYPDVGMRG